ncbi:MAG: hypothetical protein Q9228_007261 [Teloschistes exilis]
MTANTPTSDAFIQAAEDLQNLLNVRYRLYDDEEGYKLDAPIEGWIQALIKASSQSSNSNVLSLWIHRAIDLRAHMEIKMVREYPEYSSQLDELIATLVLNLASSHEQPKEQPTASSTLSGSWSVPILSYVSKGRSHSQADVSSPLVIQNCKSDRVLRVASAESPLEVLASPAGSVVVTCAGNQCSLHLSSLLDPHLGQNTCFEIFVATSGQAQVLKAQILSCGGAVLERGQQRHVNAGLQFDVRFALALQVALADLRHGNVATTSPR